MKFTAIILALGLFQAFAMAEQGGFYTIVSPGTIHSNSRFNVAVSVQQTMQPCKIKLGLEGPNFEKKIEVEVKPMTVENVEFIVPKTQQHGIWKLNAEGVSGLTFVNSTELTFVDNRPSVYVQTDKATYKPGDLVQFRVIFLDENTRPAKIDKPIDVFIKDAANNRVKLFSNIELSTGVFTNKLQLSQFPLLGHWTIEIQIDGSFAHKKTFGVRKYVLPKFEVLIDAPKYIAIQEENVEFTVRTKYTFGKLVKGKTNVIVKSQKRSTQHGNLTPTPTQYPRPHPGPYPYPYPRPHPRPHPSPYPRPYVHQDLNQPIPLYNPNHVNHQDGQNQQINNGGFAPIGWNPNNHVNHQNGQNQQRNNGGFGGATGWRPHNNENHQNGWNQQRNNGGFGPIGWRPSGNYPLSYETISTEKTFESNGKVLVELKMKDLLPDGLLFGKSYTLQIFAETQEELTDKKLNATAEITIVPHRFHMYAPGITANCSTPDGTFEYWVSVKNVLDEPIHDEKNAVTFTMGNATYNAYLNMSGIAIVNLQCATQTKTIDVAYREQTTYGTIIDHKSIDEVKNDEPVQSLRANLLTQSPSFDKDIEIEVQCPTYLNFFVYTIVARGNIIKSELIELPDEGSKNFIIKLKPTFEMMPKTHVFIYSVHNGDLKFYQNSFNIDNVFLNTIAINAPPQTTPGGGVSLKVRTDPDSFVGLMGVDQSVLLLKSGNDFNGKFILDNVGKYETKTPQTYLESIHTYPGGNCGLITMTNIHYPFQKPQRQHMYNIYPGMHLNSYGPRNSVGYAIPSSSSSSASASRGITYAAALSRPQAPMPTRPPTSIPQPQIRRKFLESWFFEDIKCFNNNNSVITKQVPDTITSWVVTGFSLNPVTGFALTKQPTKIKTFKPFFLSTNLPYSIKRGEQFKVPIIIFNYMEEPLTAEITMEIEDEEFEFTDGDTSSETSMKKITVEPNSGETISFSIRPKKIGYISLKVTAISALAGDAIKKKLKVEPEGITVFKNRDYYLYTSESEAGTEIAKTIELDIPSSIVNDSEHIEVSVMGDILGTTITNLDELVRMPAGCGEQNMVNFVPNILVLKYLQSINRLSPQIEEKAKNYLEIGYQRELTYRHENGSYSAFGKSDKSGSTWLTAYVMRSFHQAAKYIDIDKKVMDKGLRFLADVQASNGSFPEIGKVLDFSHFNDVGLTAFVLLAFLQNVEYVEQYKDAIERGFVYLEENIKQTDDLYALSIAVYALQLHKSSTVPEILKKLDADAKLDGGKKWWTKAVAELRPNQAWRPKSHDVEVTGYILMTLLERSESVLPITKWLISQRNSNGGFSSTQETVVGLQALIKFAETSGGTEKSLAIDVSSDGSNSSLKKFVVNNENSLVLQTLELQNNARKVTFNAAGKGAAILQISYRYNILEKEPEPSFKLNITLNRKIKTDNLLIDVCAQFVPLEEDKNTKESNMVVMEFALPSGYVVDKDSFSNLKKVQGVKRIETKKQDTNVIVYLDGMEKSDIKCMPIKADLVHEVTDQKPSPVVIYDYYASHKRGTEFYTVHTGGLTDNDSDESSSEEK